MKQQRKGITRELSVEPQLPNDLSKREDSNKEAGVNMLPLPPPQGCKTHLSSKIVEQQWKEITQVLLPKNILTMKRYGVSLLRAGVTGSDDSCDVHQCEVVHLNSCGDNKYVHV